VWERLAGEVVDGAGHGDNSQRSLRVPSPCAEGPRYEIVPPSSESEEEDEDSEDESVDEVDDGPSEGEVDCECTESGSVPSSTTDARLVAPDGVPRIRLSAEGPSTTFFNSANRSAASCPMDLAGTGNVGADRRTRRALPDYALQVEIPCALPHLMSRVALRNAPTPSWVVPKHGGPPPGKFTSYPAPPGSRGRERNPTVAVEERELLLARDVLRCRPLPQGAPPKAPPLVRMGSNAKTLLAASKCAGGEVVYPTKTLIVPRVLSPTMLDAAPSMLEEYNFRKENPRQAPTEERRRLRSLSHSWSEGFGPPKHSRGGLMVSSCRSRPSVDRRPTKPGGAMYGRQAYSSSLIAHE
ncbi:hypothetical protein CYMTET_34670, partial [Cymbomonas tetramitiformis]